jgi:polyhydroxyalkanoate synthesis repressor PhaR
MSVIIKRYRNRKLYNTQSKRYITLDEIEELIKDHVEVKVIENDTDNDITATTLSQIIFGLEKNQTGVLPLSLLISLVQSGGKRMDEIRRNIFNSLNLVHHFDVEIERRVNMLISNGEFDQEAGNLLLKKLLSVSYRQEELKDNVEIKLIELLRERQIPTKSDFHLLTNRIETLSKKVEGFNLGSRETEESIKGNQIIE